VRDTGIINTFPEDRCRRNVGKSATLVTHNFSSFRLNTIPRVSTRPDRRRLKADGPSHEESCLPTCTGSFLGLPSGTAGPRSLVLTLSYFSRFPGGTTRHLNSWTCTGRPQPEFSENRIYQVRMITERLPEFPDFNTERYRKCRRCRKRYGDAGSGPTCRPG